MAKVKSRLPAEVDLNSVREAAGPSAWSAALRIADSGVKSHIVWRPDARALQGYLQDGEDFAVTTVYLTPGPKLIFNGSTCTCLQESCEHAAALTLTAAHARGQDTGMRGSGQWERSLRALVPAGNEGGARHGGTVNLAVEVSLQDPAGKQGGTLRKFTANLQASSLVINARLVQPGRNGAWVAGNLSWSSLDDLSYRSDYDSGQVALLRELYWAYVAANRSAGYYGAYGFYSNGQRYLDLAQFESRQLWPLLEEAASLGLPLVYPRKLGRLPGCGTAELCLDVTRADSADGGDAGDAGDRQVSAVLELDGGGRVVPVQFIGRQGHGVVHVPAAELAAGGEPASWRFGLARLRKPVPQQLQSLAVARQQLVVPGAGLDRFRDQYYPQLRQAARVISSDESFEAPVISGPTLVLGADYGDGHSVAVSWEWLYQVGGSAQREPVNAAPGSAADPTAPGFRDSAAERALVDAITGLQLEQFGLTEPAGAEDGVLEGTVLRPATTLAGMDTMRFSTELLPLLAGQPGLEIEVKGEPADYREVSESVQIGVSADAVDGDNDWFDLGVTITVDGKPVPFAPLFMALARGDTHLLLADGAYFSLDKPELQALSRLIEEARSLADWQGSQLRISRFQADLWGELAALGLVQRQAAEWQRQVDGLLSLSAGLTQDPAPVPAGLRAELRPYQLDGFQWLAFLWAHRLGGILADDMGLGKTLQALALICHARAAEPEGAPFLIVAPTSVVSNWSAEAERFAPGLKVAVITETMARRGRDLAAVRAGADAVVTTYALLRMDSARYRALDWSGLILDEAQSVKNHQSQAYKAARELPAPVKLAITGTPMENNLMELWSLLSITAPGLFPSPDRFADYYAKPIERRGQADLLAQLRRRIRPLVKRRTKEQVARDLPDKLEQVLEVNLSTKHRKLYQTHLQRERQKVLGLLADFNGNRFTILRSLTLLRQLSLHAGLIDPEHLAMQSAKIDALADQLAEVVAGGHRALVFSQFTGFLSLVRERLDKEKIQYCYLDGSTTNRKAVIEEFKSGEVPVFLISLKAGGFGLNLTEADYCFLLDPWWNPATEAQAVDRTHRIGQTRNVVVYRLIARDTIEEKVMALQERKLKLFASVMDSGDAFGGKLSADDIRGLFE